VIAKNQPFHRRIRYAWKGVWTAARAESSFRLQLAAGAGAAFLLWLTCPGALWVALVILTVGAVLAAELINTALERIVDRLHPEQHPMIAEAKDCAAAAVLVLSIASVGVAAALVWHHFKG
jgi:diacylglycerol kinase (ATP)